MSRRISSSDLKLGMYIQKLGGSWIKHPFWRSSFLLTDPEDIKRIRQAGIKEVWIDEQKGATLEENTTQPQNTQSKPEIAQAADNPPAKETTKEKSRPPASMEAEIERARKFCSEAKTQVLAMYSDARLGKAINTSQVLPLVDEINAMVQRNSAAILSVARLKTHDDYTYMHSVAVSALMIALAHQLNLEESQIRLAGIGGLMHDIGKALMPLDVLNKPGKLTDAEYDIMKQHPQAGAELLKLSGAESEVVDIALHHHEKINGMGYPNRLQNDDISLLARMGAICDVYDAVTSERAYKKPWDPAETIRRMASWEGHFDKPIFEAFVKSVGIYPVGSLVRLSSQKLAVVIEPGSESLVKPKVRVFFSLRARAPIPMHTIDLAQASCRESIEGPEDPSQWNFKQLDDLWQ